MDSILRAAAVYAVVMLLFRVTGKRSLSQTTAFDFVLLLIVAEALQQALIDADNSMTNALLVVMTLLGIDVVLSLLKQRSKSLDHVLEGVPVVLVEDGCPIREHMAKARVDVEDILQSARQSQGLERLEQIKYAVLETSGGISIIPKQAGG